MKLSKITMSVAIFISIITLSTYAITSNADIVKKQLLKQLKPFLLLQSQSGKTLQKTASSAHGQKAPDSTETYSWENEAWKKYSCFKFSYDSKGRVIGISLGPDGDGFEEKIMYEYDPDGITLREISVFNWGFGGELFAPETMFSVMKYYPGFANSIDLINSDITIFDVATVFNTFSLLDSIVSVGYERDEDGEFDTLHWSLTRYTKTGSKSVRANIQTVSESASNKLISYYADYINSGAGLVDTLKCFLHISADMDSEYAAMLTEVQCLIYIVQKNQLGKIVEQSTMTGTDSNFTDFTELSKINVYHNSSGDIDSCVTQAYDKDLKTWENNEKVVYLYKKIIAGVKESINKHQVVQQVTFEKKNGTLYLNIPNGMTVSVLELFDFQGKVISRTAVPDAKSSIVLGPISKHSSTVNLLRLKTDRGDFTYKYLGRAVLSY